MAGEAFEIMKRASIFMILAQTIIYFRPQESYEKYLRFLIHLLLIVVLFFPVVDLLDHSAGSRMQSSLAAYTRQMEQLMNGVESIEIEGFVQEDSYISTLQSEVKIRLNNYSEQTGYIVKSVEIKGIGQMQEMDSGSEVKLYITVTTGSDAVSTIKVDKVKWTGNTVEKEEKDKKSRIPTEQEQRLKAQYAQILGMEQSNLEVLTDEVDAGGGQ